MQTVACYNYTGKLNQSVKAFLRKRLKRDQAAENHQKIKAEWLQGFQIKASKVKNIVKDEGLTDFPVKNWLPVFFERMVG